MNTSEVSKSMAWLRFSSLLAVLPIVFGFLFWVLYRILNPPFAFATSFPLTRDTWNFLGSPMSSAEQVYLDGPRSIYTSALDYTIVPAVGAAIFVAMFLFGRRAKLIPALRTEQGWSEARLLLVAAVVLSSIYTALFVSVATKFSVSPVVGKEREQYVARIAPLAHAYPNIGKEVADAYDETGAFKESIPLGVSSSEKVKGFQFIVGFAYLVTLWPLWALLVMWADRLSARLALPRPIESQIESPPEV